MADDRSILDDFAAEQHELHDVLVGLSAEQWAAPSPAAGWTVRDQVAHLADTEELAHDTATGGPRQINEDVSRFPSGEAFTEAGCARGRAMVDGPAVLDWWWRAAERNRAALAALASDTRVPWGLGMGWRAFCTARLMEHWAHGLDIRAGAGLEAVDTDRLRHVAWIGLNAVPYALSVAGVDPPAGHSLRLELTGPGGEQWTVGKHDATDRITGPAGQWCRLAVQRTTRDQAPDLVAEGPLAELALAHARAFL